MGQRQVWGQHGGGGHSRCPWGHHHGLGALGTRDGGRGHLVIRDLHVLARGLLGLWGEQGERRRGEPGRPSPPPEPPLTTRKLEKNPFARLVSNRNSAVPGLVPSLPSHVALASHLASLSLSFPICIMGIIVPASSGYHEDSSSHSTNIYSAPAGCQAT